VHHVCRQTVEGGELLGLRQGVVGLDLSQQRSHLAAGGLQQVAFVADMSASIGGALASAGSTPARTSAAASPRSLAR